MAKVQFPYYMHDDYNSYERAEWISNQTGIEIDDELVEKIGRPFYEIKLDCELDTETGEVTILGVG